MATTAVRDMTTSDEELFSRFRHAGDLNAYEALVHRYETPLFGYLQRYIGDAAVAEEVFQATFLRLYTRHEQFVEGRAFRPWLYAIATHQAIDAQRQERRHRRVVHEGIRACGSDGASLLEAVPAAGLTPADQVGDREEGRRMQAAVQSLSEVQRRTVQLVYGQGLAYSDAAAILGVPVGTVKSRLHSALLALARIWGVAPPRRAFALAAKLA